jgi:hypothetical protein
LPRSSPGPTGAAWQEWPDGATMTEE